MLVRRHRNKDRETCLDVQEVLLTDIMPVYMIGDRVRNTRSDSG